MFAQPSVVLFGPNHYATAGQQSTAQTQTQFPGQAKPMSWQTRETEVPALSAVMSAWYSTALRPPVEYGQRAPLVGGESSVNGSW